MLETLKTTIAYPVNAGGSIRFVYPSGRNASSYQKHGEILVLSDGTILRDASDAISVSYDEIGVTVAYGPGPTIPTGPIALKIPLVPELSDQLAVGPVFGTDATYAGIMAARGRALAAGGGVIQLPDATIPLTAPIPCDPGVLYRGVRPRLSFTTSIPDSVWSFSGGTVLKGDGTFAAFEANATAAGSPPTSFAGGVANFGLEDIGFDTFTRAISIGAQNTLGLMYSRLNNLFIQNCTDWGINLENFMHCQIERIWVRESKHGMRFASSLPSGTLMPGNSRLNTLFVIPKQSNPNLCRGIVFEGAGGVLNQMETSRLQVNRFGGSEVTQTATLTSGSANISVSDGTKFAVGMPVVFAAGGSGFNALQTYIVLSVSGNTLTVGPSYGDGAITASGSSTPTIKTQGYANVEVIGTGGGQVSNSTFDGLDLEGIASCSLYAESVMGSEFWISEINNTQPYNHFVLRNSFNDIVFCTNGSAITDFDAASSSAFYMGARATIRQRTGAGIWIDGTRGNMGILQLTGGNDTPEGTLEVRASGSCVYPGNMALGQRVTQRNDTSRSLGVYADSGVMIFGGSSASVWTLPTITNANEQTSMVGVIFEIVNAGSANLTINTSGGQLLNGQVGKTSVTLTPNQSIKLVASLNWSNALLWAAFAGNGVVI